MRLDLRSLLQTQINAEHVNRANKPYLVPEIF
jgi:hypothetical protein